MNKIILVTGANRGIGYETARQLGKSGHTILLGARDEVKGKEAADQLAREGMAVHFIVLDVSNEQSIRDACVTVSSKFPHLDVIINNAAILSREDRNILTVKSDVVEQTLLTNVVGPLTMVQVFLPLLKRNSRVINVSSGGGSMTDPVGGWSPVYCVSKAALNMITRHQSYFLADKGVTANAVCPGWVRTDMGGKHASRSPERGAQTIVWLATEAPSSLTGKFFRDKKEIPW